MTDKRVLNVGSCAADNSRLARLFEENFSIQIINEATAAGALQFLASDRCDLVLVNRVLDQDGSSGLDLIKEIKSNPDFSDLPVMLVSNFADYQERAVSFGAELGIGKAELDQPSTMERLGRCLDVVKGDQS